MPATLHELAAALLDGMGADTLVSLMRLLDESQAAHLEAITQADNDDTSAEAIVGLMQSLMANPTTVVGMQRALGSEHIAAFQQIAVLAKRHLDERGAHQSEAAPPALGDAASPEKDEPSS